jgi:hypothetical protein
MLRLALVLVLVLLLPAAASAAPFGELAPMTVKSPGSCLRATGAPGEVVRWAPGGADFLQATASGFGASVHIKLGDSFGECPIAVAQPSGAGVVLQLVDEGIGVAVRDPGGSFGPAQTLGTPDAPIDDPVAAVTPRGDVAVGWTEKALVKHDVVARVLVARRPAGGTFGAPVELQPPKPYDFARPRVVLGMQDDGTVVALWSEGGAAPRERIRAAVAPPGAPFGPSQVVTPKLELAAFSVTVAPNGRALALVSEPSRSLLLERPPGGTFTQVADLRDASFFGPPAAALRPDGAALVVYQDSDAQLVALRRDSPGPFRREQVGPRPKDPFGLEEPDFGDEAPDDYDGRGPHPAFAPDGRAILAWAPAHTLGSLDWAAATVATFPGGVRTLSGPVRDTDSITPVMLADGTPAVVWSDVAAGGSPLLHLAVEGAPAAAEPPAPRVDIGRIRQIHQGLALPFRCSAACDVRAAVPDDVFGRRSLRAAGSGLLKLEAEDYPILLRRPDSVRVEVISGAPGARTATRRGATAKLRVPPVPRLLGITAVRRGKRQIVVSWHTDRPLRDATILGGASTNRTPIEPVLDNSVKGAGRTRFQLSLRASGRGRYVQLYLLYEPDRTQRRVAVVRVTKGT